MRRPNPKRDREQKEEGFVKSVQEEADRSSKAQFNNTVKEEVSRRLNDKVEKGIIAMEREKYLRKKYAEKKLKRRKRKRGRD